MQPIRVRYTGTPRSPEETERLVELLAAGVERFLIPSAPAKEDDVDFFAELSVHSDDRQRPERGAPNA